MSLSILRYGFDLLKCDTHRNLNLCNLDETFLTPNIISSPLYIKFTRCELNLFCVCLMTEFLSFHKSSKAVWKFVSTIRVLKVIVHYSINILTQNSEFICPLGLLAVVYIYSSLSYLKGHVFLSRGQLDITVHRLASQK